MTTMKNNDEVIIVGTHLNYTIGMLRVNSELILEKLNEIKEDIFIETIKLKEQYYHDVYLKLSDKTKKQPNNVEAIIKSILNEENIIMLNNTLDAIDDLNSNIEAIDEEIELIENGYAPCYNSKTGTTKKIKWEKKNV